MTHSLRTKFVLLFLILFFIPFGLLTLISVSMSKGMMKESTISHLQNLVEVKGVAIEQWLKERIGDAKTISESQEIKSLDPKRIEPYVKLVKGFYQAYREISVFDLNGKRIPATEGISSKQEEWFQGALEQGTFVSKPMPGASSSGATITISAVIKHRSGTAIGVLRELVNLTYISELISEAKLGETGELYLIDPEGNFVLHRDLKELSNKTILKVPYFESPQVKRSYTGTYADYRGNEVLGSWRWIPGLQCFLISEQDAKEAFYQTGLLVKKASIIFVISTLLILGLSYWTIGAVTNPIKALSKAVTSLAGGHFNETLVASRKDEIGTLIEGFNTMAGRLKEAYSDLEGKIKASNRELEIAYRTLKQRQEQLVRSEKMAALGQLSAGIAHEIRTPLTSIKIFIQSLEKEIDLDENRSEDFRIIKKEIDRINENVTRFLNFARPEEPQFQQVDVNALLGDTLNLLMAKIRSSGIRLDVSLPEALPPVEGDPKQLNQVFLNLVLNAVEAMPKGGTLSIGASLRMNPDIREEGIQIVFQDTGAGISEEDRPYLFDPFFTTKEKGTGLGLSIVYSIIQRHNGWIEVKSAPGKGSSFIVSLPVWKERTWKESSSSMMT
jgi:two-component system, NtrC family, sensor kinase